MVGLYDVEFVDGSCVSIFDGCDDASDFMFDNAFDAQDAARALLTQVFIGSLIDDLFPGVTFGCDILVPLCATHTPYGFAGGGVITWVANNWAADQTPMGLFDLDERGGMLAGTDTTALQSVNYAVWTPVSPVPVPAAIWLFGTALIGLVGFGKRREAA